MRTLLIAVGVVSHLTANAQSTTTRPAGSSVDFSGVYSSIVFGGVPTVIEPDAALFTAQAERSYNAYDPEVDPRGVEECAPERVPVILWSDDPMELVQETGRIVMRFENGDTVRSIPLGGAAPPADQPHTELGYSVGHWVGDVLTIETTHLLGGLIRNNRGHPISGEARITERYWREPGENDLHMELVIDDPVNYTEPLTLGRVWNWSPDEQVRPWNCLSLGPWDSEPDFNELRSLLNQQ